MEKRSYNVLAENGNKRLLSFVPEEECEFAAVGATEEEIRESFPDYEPGKLDFYLNTYFIEENGVIHVKGPDGVDITKELYGDDVFEK